MVTAEDEYAFSDARTDQWERLRALEAVLDPGTIRLVSELGIRTGWRCLEVGAGGGSVARWLGEQVGPAGHVTAADVDPRWLTDLPASNSDVLSLDVQRDPLPDRAYDLVHARLLLAWLAEPDRALQSMVRAVKRGGVVLVEEMDFRSVATADEAFAEVFTRVVRAHTDVLETLNTFDGAYGRRVADALVRAGLTDVRTAGRAEVFYGGSAGARVWQLTLRQLRAQIAARGMASERDVDAAVALCDDPAFGFLSQVTVAAWGTRPG